MKLITVVGARPQFIKAAVVSRVIAKWNLNHNESQMEEVIIHTGQHYDMNMSEVFFDQMSIPCPKYNLHIGGGTHGAMTGQMLERIEQVLLDEKPDVMLVYGDTDSTLAGALAAAKLHIPIAHVEAGLRSFNMNMPEEINRILTDRLSTWLFCPTATAVQNLWKEGYRHFHAQISCVGDVMYDASLFYRGKGKKSDYVKALLAKLPRFYLATVHRAENTDNPVRIKNIVEALDRIAEQTPVVLPLHPRMKKVMAKHGLSFHSVMTIAPIGYFDMIALQEHCVAVFTDSGGVQKEAYFFHKPCITLRDETEWVELVEQGVNQLVGAENKKILTAEYNLYKQENDFSTELYGKGNAGLQIVRALQQS